MQAETGERRRVVTWDDPVEAARRGRDLAGLDYLRAMVRGELPPPPIVQLLGIRMASVDEGVVRMELPVGEHLYNPLGSVHGGAIATILDSVLGCAVHSVQPRGRGYTTLEIKVNYVRAVTEAVGTVIAEGRVVHAGRQSAVAEAKLTDGAGKLYATASTTCLVFEIPAAAAGA
ncbi:MAG: PaaI family thioesterase, partial [Methylobacteriaceae bacterium]|nr:PaaI family thioesterase [Methylobacteriaceae bacterium]